MKRFCVIGSLNVDLIVTADRLPRPSETVIAKDFQINTAGGKGANQAVALARLGENVSLVGKIQHSVSILGWPGVFHVLLNLLKNCSI